MKGFACPICDKENNDSTPVGTEQTPSAGSFSICIGCGGVSVFTGHELEVRLPNDAELVVIATNPTIKAFQAAWRKLRQGGEL